MSDDERWLDASECPGCVQVAHKAEANGAEIRVGWHAEDDDEELPRFLAVELPPGVVCERPGRRMRLLAQVCVDGEDEDVLQCEPNLRAADFDLAAEEDAVNLDFLRECEPRAGEEVVGAQVMIEQVMPSNSSSLEMLVILDGLNVTLPLDVRVLTGTLRQTTGFPFGRKVLKYNEDDLEAHALTIAGAPTVSPSAAPTTAPSTTPSAAPSRPPSQAPSLAPSTGPSDAPSAGGPGPSISPTVAPTPAPRELAKQSVLDDKGRLEVVAVDELGNVDITLQVRVPADFEGWAAFGLSEQGRMLGSTALVGRVWASGATALDVYMLESKSAAGLVRIGGAQSDGTQRQRLQAGSPCPEPFVSKTGEILRLHYCGSSLGGMYMLDGSGEPLRQVIVALGDDPFLGSGHSPQNRDVVQLVKATPPAGRDGVQDRIIVTAVLVAVLLAASIVFAVSRAKRPGTDRSFSASSSAADDPAYTPPTTVPRRPMVSPTTTAYQPQISEPQAPPRPPPRHLKDFHELPVSAS